MSSGKEEETVARHHFILTTFFPPYAQTHSLLTEFSSDLWIMSLVKCALKKERKKHSFLQSFLDLQASAMIWQVFEDMGKAVASLWHRC